jgi:hypothetical protein
MGMYCQLHRATEADVDRLLADPDAVAGFLDPPGSGPRTREVRPKGLFGFLLRLTPITISEVDPDDDTPWAPPDPDRTIDIEKGWHGLHFLLTGTADGGEEPGDFLLEGGEPLDDEGHARAFRPVQVERVAHYLASLSAEEVAGRYDPERMVELDIYPAVWTREQEEDGSRKWLLDCFQDVRDFVARAAAARDCVIVNVS